MHWRSNGNSARRSSEVPIIGRRIDTGGPGGQTPTHPSADPFVPVPPHSAKLQALLSERILLLDGAMGTMIQRARLAEEDYRGARFRDWSRELRGNNDLLSLTQPRLVRDIHAQYLAAGADIIETNTFNSTSVALADYDMQALARE